MIFNGGPSGNASSAGINFNFGGKFNLETDIQISFDNETYQNLKFYSNETTTEKEYYELRYQDEENPDAEKWYIKFLDNCYIQLSKKLKCDLFMVGKGQNGGNGVANANVTSDNGPAGGSGGKIFEELNKEFSASIYNIIIKNDNTQITDMNNQILYSSSNGNIYFSSGENNDSNGGAGAIVTTTGGINSTGGEPADSGEDGIKKYGIYYGAGGGGGGCSRFYVTGINPNVSEGIGHYYYAAQSQPGAVGGGENSSNSYSGGCGAYSTTQRNALPNTGSGGGGGYSDTNSKSNGGTGSYGTIIISSL